MFWLRYDGKPRYAVSAECISGMWRIPLKLESGASAMFVIESQPASWKLRPSFEMPIVLEGQIQVTLVSFPGGEEISAGVIGNSEPLPDLSDQLIQRRLLGSVRYDMPLEIPQSGLYQLIVPAAEDCAFVSIDDEKRAMLIGAPFCCHLELEVGIHALQLEFPLMPVWNVPGERSALTMIPPVGLRERPQLAAGIRNI